MEEFRIKNSLVKKKKKKNPEKQIPLFIKNKNILLTYGVIFLPILPCWKNIYGILVSFIHDRRVSSVLEIFTAIHKNSDLGKHK